MNQYDHLSPEYTAETIVCGNLTHGGEVMTEQGALFTMRTLFELAEAPHRLGWERAASKVLGCLRAAEKVAQ